MAKPAFHTCHKTYSSCFSPTGFAHPPAPTCAELWVGKAAGSKAIVEDFMSVKCVPPTQRSLFVNALSLNRIQIWGVKKKTKWAGPALEKYLEEKFSVRSPRSLYNSLWKAEPSWVSLALGSSPCRTAGASGHQRPLKGLFCVLSLWWGRCDVSQGDSVMLTLARDTHWGLSVLAGTAAESNGSYCKITWTFEPRMDSSIIHLPMFLLMGLKSVLIEKIEHRSLNR